MDKKITYLGAWGSALLEGRAGHIYLCLSLPMVARWCVAWFSSSALFLASFFFWAMNKYAWRGSAVCPPAVLFWFRLPRLHAAQVFGLADFGLQRLRIYACPRAVVDAVSEFKGVGAASSFHVGSTHGPGCVAGWPGNIHGSLVGFWAWHKFTPSLSRVPCQFMWLLSCTICFCLGKNSICLFLW